MPTDRLSTAPAVEPIRKGGVYLKGDFCRRLRWKAHAWRQAKRAGLRSLTFGRQVYILGSDALAFFSQIAEQQEEARKNGNRD